MDLKWGHALASINKDENVGHANFQLYVNENSRGFNFSDPKKCLIKGDKVFTKPPVFNGTQLVSKPEQTLMFSYSFWPNKVQSNSSFFKDLLALTHFTRPSKGVCPEFSNHQKDKAREGLHNETIVHRANNSGLLDKLKHEKNILIDEIIDLGNGLFNKENVEKDLLRLKKVVVPFSYPKQLNIGFTN